MNNIFIHGSCVTRDIFRVMEKKHNFQYYSRSSIISLMSKPLPITETDVASLVSAFQRKTVIDDFQKVFLKWFEETSADVLIIDLIDERMSVLHYEDSYITQSVYMRNAGADKLYPFEIIPQNDEKRHVLWENACQVYVEALLKFIPAEKIIIHEAYWSTHYLQDNQLVPMEKANFTKINNQTLDRYYGYLKHLLPNSISIRQEPIADPDHEWGLAPFHYIKSYYVEVYQKLLATGLITE